MAEVRFSELMDNYTDNELLIEGEQMADTEAVLRGVTERIGSPKRRLRLGAKIMIAAAAAVGLSAVAVTADLPARFFGKYETASGIVIDIADKHKSVVGTGTDAPIEYRGGRVIFTACGENKDITDIIDDETPYIYAYRNSAGLQSYLIVGGEAGRVGYADISNIGTEEEPVWFGADVDACRFPPKYSVYGVDLAYIGITEEQLTELEESDLTHPLQTNEDGSRVWKESEYRQRFVQTAFLEGHRVSEWFMRAGEYLDLFEAKERMCCDPDWSDRELPSDEEFMSRLCQSALTSGSAVWYRSLEELEQWGRFDYSAAHEPPIEERDGRLWVKANGAETDITDLVDENTPYILPLDRPEDWEEGRSYEAYLVVGGTPGNYKFAELFNNASNTSLWGTVDRSQFIEIGDDVYSYTFTVDGEPIEWEQLIDSLKQGVDLTERFGVETYYEPWYKAACDELAIMGGSVLYAR